MNARSLFSLFWDMVQDFNLGFWKKKWKFGHELCLMAQYTKITVLYVNPSISM